MFKTTLWTREPPKDNAGTFIWAYWDAHKQRWQSGLGYWTITKGQWRDAQNWNGDPHRRATHFHPMPEAPE